MTTRRTPRATGRRSPTRIHGNGPKPSAMATCSAASAPRKNTGRNNSPRRSSTSGRASGVTAEKYRSAISQGAASSSRALATVKLPAAARTSPATGVCAAPVGTGQSARTRPAAAAVNARVSRMPGQRADWRWLIRAARPSRRAKPRWRMRVMARQAARPNAASSSEPPTLPARPGEAKAANVGGRAGPSNAKTPPAAMTEAAASIASGRTNGRAAAKWAGGASSGHCRAGSCAVIGFAPRSAGEKGGTAALGWECGSAGAS